MKKDFNLEDLLQEDSVGSRLQIPKSFKEIIKNFQAAYRGLNGSWISREKVVILMMIKGVDKIISETEEMLQKTN